MPRLFNSGVLARVCSFLPFDDILRCRLACNTFFQATHDRFDEAYAEYHLSLDSHSLSRPWHFLDTRVASLALDFGGAELFANPDTLESFYHVETFEATSRYLRGGVILFRLASAFDRLQNLRRVSIKLQSTSEFALPWWMKLVGGDVEKLNEYWPEDVTRRWLSITLRALSMAERQLNVLEVVQGDGEIPLPLSMFKWPASIPIPQSSPVTVHKLSFHINCDMHDHYSPARLDGKDEMQNSIKRFFASRFIFEELDPTIADAYTEEGQSARWRLTSTIFLMADIRSLKIDSEVINVLPEEILAFCRKNKETLQKLSLRWLVLYPQDMEGMIKLLRAMRFRMPLLTSVAINVAWRREDGTEDSEQEFVAIMKEGRDGSEVMDNEIAALEEYLECLES